jgi:hypothetical protein
MRDTILLRFSVWLLALTIFFLVGGWLSGWGHASFAAFGMFGSWGVMAAFPLRLLHFTGSGFAMFAVAWTLLAPLAYWGALCWFSRVLVRRRGISFYFIVPLFHVVGGFLAAVTFGSGHLVTQRNVRYNYFISIALLAVFFGLDWLLLEREVEPQASSTRAERAAGGG